jgi:hypothetical protein
VVLGCKWVEEEEGVGKGFLYNRDDSSERGEGGVGLVCEICANRDAIPRRK